MSQFDGRRLRQSFGSIFQHRLGPLPPLLEFIFPNNGAGWSINANENGLKRRRMRSEMSAGEERRRERNGKEVKLINLWGVFYGGRASEIGYPGD